MPTLSTAQITGLISLALVLTGVIVVNNLEKSYYCEPEDNVKECVRLSSSGLTCYYLTAPDVTKGDRCTNGKWELLEGHVVTREVPVTSSAAENPVFSNECIVKGKWCYCNPRGSLDNKRLC